MPDVALMLGPVLFRDFEIPERISFGGRQRLAVHRLVGGRRVVDCLGRDDSEIVFRGTISGGDATSRAGTLDALRIVGDPLVLSWDTYYYAVILSRFEAEYHSTSWIPYRIACTVLQDQSWGGTDTAVSLVSSIFSDLSAAAAIGPDRAVQLMNIRASVGAQGATVRDTRAYSAALSGLVDTRTTIDTEIDYAESELSKSRVSADTLPDYAIAGLMTAAQSAGDLAELTALRAYVGRAHRNLASAST